MASDSILIAGRTRQVNKIMVYKMEWLKENYFDPMRQLAGISNNSASAAVTYTRSPTTVSSNTYSHPVTVNPTGSNKYKYICCCIVCLLIIIVPSIIGGIASAISSKKS